MASTHYTEIVSAQKRKLAGATDLGILLLSVILVGIGCYLFLHPPYEQIPLRGFTQIARIDSLRENSQRKISGTLSWIETNAADRLYEGDQILTSKVSSVEVSFDDGPKLSIGPQSLVRIRRNRDGYAVELVKGVISHKAGRPLEVIDTNSGKKLKLAPGSGVLTSRKGVQRHSPDKTYFKEGNLIDPMRQTTLELTKLPADASQASILDGSGQELSLILLGKGSTKISTPSPGRYSFVLKDSSGKSLSTANFRVLPYSPPQLELLSATKTYVAGESLPLRWNGPNGITYIVGIKGPQGQERYTTTTTEFSYPLKASGQHRFQISISESGQELRGNEKTAEIKFVDGLQLANELLNQTILVNETARFEVLNNPYKTPVFIDIAQDSDFRLVTKSVELTQNKNRVPMPTPGIFYAKARTNGPSTLLSKTVRIVVTGPIAKNSPRYSSKQAIEGTSKQAKLSWQSERGAGRVKVQLASDPGMAKIIKEIETDKTEIAVEVPSIGSYYWRILPTEASPEYLIASQVQSLSIVLPPALGVPQIIPQQIIHYEEDEGIPNHKIQVVPYEYAKEYFLEVFADPKAKNLVFRSSSSQPVINWMSSRTGKYYYRVRVEDVWGRFSQYSNLGELIFPISPLVDL